MSKNRLQLNFALDDAVDRTDFVINYLDEIDFELNDHEIETIANYLLWGKNSAGRNVQQEGDIELKKWAKTQVESLDALIELPGFSEHTLRPLHEPPARIRRETFSREEALINSPPYMRALYEDLFKQIDTIELIINFYELFVGKRKLPPRESLLKRFTADEQKALNKRALKLSQYKYLKLKHQLVELRQQQYIYSDTYSNRINLHLINQPPLLDKGELFIGEDIDIYPIGTWTDDPYHNKIFGDPNPYIFTDEEKERISQDLWKHTTNPVLDFTNPKHVLALINSKHDLEDAAIEDPEGIYGAAGALVKTLDYYISKAHLKDALRDILGYKLENWSNLQIARQVNKDYDKTYNENYISTLFHQKIVPAIAQAAQEHREILENIFFPENFKKCKDCGRVLLINNTNFMRQKKSSDGFAPRCKKCEKLKRSKYK